MNLGKQCFGGLIAGLVALTSLGVSQAAPTQASAPSISASPNPVSATGSTTITWSTGDGSTGQVYVSVNGGGDTLVSQAPSGSTAVPWITAGNMYLFKLFAGTSHASQLASVTVFQGTGSAAAISAAPNPVTASTSSGTTTISWNTGNGTIGQVYVSANGGGETLLAQGITGSASAPWITPGTTFLFRLYAGTSHSTQLASTTVMMAAAIATAATISASPNPVSTTGSGNTTVQWNTGNGSTGQVYVSQNGGAEVLFAQGTTGTAAAPWISAGNTYTFTLYSGTSHSTQLTLTSVKTVTAQSTCTGAPSNSSVQLQACMQAVVDVINQHRASVGLSALSLNTGQVSVNGTSCGSWLHSYDMAQTNSIWHVNASYPNESFPNNFCSSWHTEGENVGYSFSGTELTDLQNMDNQMWGEAHDSATCASTVNHACNMINGAFTQVGIGIYVSPSGYTWLTEDFMG